MPLKTRQQVREEFANRGLSFSAWARARGYSGTMVLAIINDDERQPRYKCSRGDAHNIAVELGIKRGEIFRRNEVRSKLAMPA